jgi:hypothetical protein
MKRKFERKTEMMQEAGKNCVRVPDIIMKEVRWHVAHIEDEKCQNMLV